MHARTLRIVLIAIAIMGSAASAVWLTFSLNPSSAEANAILLHNQPAAVPAAHLRTTLHRVGLDALSLAAAGVNGETQVNAIVERIETELSGNPLAITTAEQAVGAARQTIAELEHRIQSGAGSAQDVTDLAAARTNLGSAVSARDELVNNLFNAGVFTLSQDARTRLATMRSNGSAWALPIEFLVVNREEAAWVALRAALAHERIAIARGESPSAAVQALLSDVRSNTSVALAISNLASNQATVAALWTAATAS